jgi:hypothetical protein
MLKQLWQINPNRWGRFSKNFRVFLSLIAVLTVCSSPLRGATFTATLDRDSLVVGENATLTLNFEGGQPRSIPVPPNLPNLHVSSSGTSISSEFINGQSRTTLAATYVLTPTQPGDYVIPGFTAEVGGEKLSTQPLKLKALKPGAPSAAAINSGSQVTFMKLVLPKKQMYVGETILAQLELYIQGNVRINQFSLTSFPADGCIIGKMVQGNPRRAQVGSMAYNMVPLTFPIKSVKNGPINVGPVTATVVAAIPTERGRQDSFLERFGLGTPAEQRQLTLATESDILQSLPLPNQNVPANFNGAVGAFSMNVSAGPTNVTVGDPITVRVQISGQGAFDTLTLPDPFTSTDFKAYPATVKSAETTDQFGLQGSKTFEQVIVPQNAEIKQLPPVTFAFFDPERATYRTLTHPPLRLVIQPAATSPPPTIATAIRRSEAETPAPAQDIVPIKTRLGTVAQITPTLVRQPWFLALQLLPVLALVFSVLMRRQANNFANNPRLRRQRQVAQIIRDGLDELRQFAAGNQSDNFFATLFRLLQEQLGERLNLPAFAITEAVIEEHLQPRHTPEATLSQLRELFQSCNLARYAPIRSSQELAALIPRIESTLRELQSLKL